MPLTVIAADQDTREETGTNWTGTPSQIEWAVQIKPTVDAEFARLANTLRQVAARQQGQARLDTASILVILEEKRVATLAVENAGYFMSVWREPGDQVRRLLTQDHRFLAIEAARLARKTKATA